MMKVSKLLNGLLLTSIAQNGKGFVKFPMAVATRPYSNTLASFRGRNDNLPILRPFFGRELDDVFSVLDEFDSVLPRPFDRRSFGRSLATDFKETKDQYELIVDLPGVDPKDIDIKLRGNDLTISAHRESHKKEDGTNFHRVERSSGHITRTFSLPENADHDSIVAENKNGVLHLKVKKSAPTHPHEKKIEVKVHDSNNAQTHITAAAH
jgi:HSP20 family protein